MNKQEAITILAGLYCVPIENGADEFASEINKAIDMAIEALSDGAVQGAGRYENAMQKLREMPRCFNGVKAKQIKNIPSEVVEVVRCKDCRHRDLFSCPLAENDFQKDDDYCSWGERREP